MLPIVIVRNSAMSGPRPGGINGCLASPVLAFGVLLRADADMGPWSTASDGGFAGVDGCRRSRLGCFLPFFRFRDAGRLAMVDKLAVLAGRGGPLSHRKHPVVFSE